MVVLIWQVMSWNGVLTGMMISIMQIVLTGTLKTLSEVPTGSSMAVAGAASPGTAVLWIVTSMTPTAAPPPSVFAF